MGKTGLFRWEDSDALKHHCGFCERPLSHPAAKSSCFGTHAEPCHRFHQRMFMRLRGHTCDMCMHTNEHHYKRHFKTCEQIRRIYECCGEDWPIIPNDGDDRGRSRSRGSDSFESDGRSSTSDDVPMRKKDKKEQKKQIRAASRSKVVTQEEINYISSVLHPVSQRQGDIAHPRNPDEIEEIEQHLKHNAQCYNDGGQKWDHSTLLLHIPDADVDFETEMERILGVLRVVELLKRNDRNRGLRNKELSAFKNLVAELKVQIIDDLILSKRDDLEVKMRRAAFLRYTNRASYDIMTSRYTEKDWKTGEKIRSAGSGSLSSGSLTVVDEEESNEYGNLTKLEVQSSISQSISLENADRRHIEYSHKKIGEDGRYEQTKVISQMGAIRTTSKPPPSLRIVSTNVATPRQTNFRNPWGPRSEMGTTTTPTVLGYRTHCLTKSSSQYSLPPSKDMWPSVNETASLSRASTTLNGSFKAVIGNTPGSKGPWDLSKLHLGPTINQSAEPADSMQSPIESRKRKTKKKTHEVLQEDEKATANAISAPTHTCTSSGDMEVKILPENSPHTHALLCQELADSEEEPLLDIVRTLNDEVGAVKSDVTKGYDHGGVHPFAYDDVTVSGNQKESGKTNKFELTNNSNDSHVTPMGGPPSAHADNSCKIPTSKVGRHRDWIKFTDSFKFDRISNLVFTPDHTAYNNHTGCLILDCPFENSGTRNCPYHKTYCKCVDPLQPFNDKVIVYADTNPSQIGPFNCMRAEKLLRFFDTQPETKGRLMLIDAELYSWLQAEGRHWNVESLTPKTVEHTPVPTHMPKRLFWEADDYLRGYDKGRLLKQIDQLKDLASRNELVRSRLSQPAVTKEYLEDMQMEYEPRSDDGAFCYCKDNYSDNPSKEDKLVECAYSNCSVRSFHRSCAQKLGYDRVTTWYCGICEHYMCVEAHKAVLWAQESYRKRRN